MNVIRFTGKTQQNPKLLNTELPRVTDRATVYPFPVEPGENRRLMKMAQTVRRLASPANSPGTSRIAAEKTSPDKRTSRKYTSDQVIKLMPEYLGDNGRPKKNPKKEGSNAYRRFALYRDGMTVGKFLADGGISLDLTWDTQHKFIRIEKATAPTATPVKTDEKASA